MFYLKSIVICSVVFHLICLNECYLLEGILLGSALSQDSDDTEYIVIRIPEVRQRNVNRRRVNRNRSNATIMTSTTETPTTTETSTTTGQSTTTGTMETYNKTTTSTTETTTPLLAINDEKCAENETYTDCFNECGRKCENIFENRFCGKQCFGFGCTCAKYYFRDTLTEKCVVAHECPQKPKCPPGETFYECGGCGPTCSEPNPVCAHTCKEQGNCDCKGGLARNIHGKCVPLSLCGLTKNRHNFDYYISHSMNKFINKTQNS